MGAHFFNLPEILGPLGWLALAFAIAHRHHYRPVGWACAWIILIGIGGALRIVAEFSPSFAVGLGFASSAFGYIFLFRQSSPGALLRKVISPPYLPLSLMALFVLSRSFFPIFDVDSLNYHLPTLDWLYHRSDLPVLQQHYASKEVRYFWIGFEDFLAFPGVPFNLLLFAGMLSGVFKILSLFSLVSTIPAVWPFLRYCVGLLLLVDDHFFFSGHNANVYINPTFMGSIGLLAFLSFRGLRGHRESAFVALILSFAITATKHHGIYLFLFTSCVLAWAVYKNAKHLRRRHIFLALGAGLGVFAVYAINWIETGSPFYPFELGPWKLRMPFESRFVEFYKGESLWEFLVKYKHRVFLFPGNLALKMSTLLFPLAALLLLTQRQWQSYWPRLRRQRRSLLTAVWCMAFGLGWVLLSTHILAEETKDSGRFPRYAFGAAVIGVLAFVSAFRVILPASFRSFFKPLQWPAGLLMVAWLVAMADSRVTNIPVSWRPSWRDYWQVVAHPENRELRIENPIYSKMLPLTAVREMLELKSCFGDDKYLEDGRFIASSARTIVPIFIFGRYGYRISPRGGAVAPLLADLESPTPTIRHLLVSKQMLDQQADSHSWGERAALIPYAKKGKLLCTSEALAIVELPAKAGD